MAKQSTFQRLCKIVEDSGIHENYKDDLYTLDRKTMELWPDGTKFVFGWRTNGTDILMMGAELEDYRWKRPNLDPEEAGRILRENFIIIDYSNTEFIYFDGSNFFRKPCDELRKIYMTHVDIIISKSKAKQHEHVY